MQFTHLNCAIEWLSAYSQNCVSITAVHSRTFSLPYKETPLPSTSVQFSSVAQSRPTLQPDGLQHARLPCPSPTPKFAQTHVHWVSDAIQPSHPLSSPSPPAPNPSQHQGLFPVSQFFESGGQSIGVSDSASVLPMNIQDWFPLRWTGWISLQSKGLSRVFSNTAVQKQQFFGAQLSSQSNSHIHTWPLYGVKYCGAFQVAQW